MLVPGLSGGTTAILLGIYHDLLFAFTRLFKDKKMFAKRFVFLLSALAGGLLGLYLLASPVFFLFSRFRAPMTVLFLVIILAGVPVLLREAGVNHLSEIRCSDIKFTVIGCLCVLLVSFIPLSPVRPDAVTAWGAWDIFQYIISGLVIAVALVLPGISASHMLLLLGMYPTVIEAIAKGDIPLLSFLAVCVGIGVILSAGILSKFLDSRARTTNFLIIGFVLGSCAQICSQVM